MPSTTAACDTPARESRAEANVTELIAELVRRTRIDAGNGPGVLLDVDVGGVRCLLLRTDTSPAHVLSPREHEIARMIAAGHPNKTIAAVLEISTWTVGTYLRRMFAKLGVTSRAAMVAKLIESEPLHSRRG